jgi:hypothetical protein
MSVRAGAACPVWARSTTAQIDMMTITLSPQHGTAKPRGRTGVIYRPAPGFRGEDAFAYVRQGASSQYRGSSLVRVNVRVE